MANERLREFLVSDPAPAAPEGVNSDQLRSALTGGPRRPREERGLASELATGLARGTDATQMTLYGLAGLAGRELGIGALQEYGERGVKGQLEEIQANAPSVAGFTDIETPNDFFRWASGALGEGIPSIATIVAAGGLGGAVVRKGVETSIKRTITDRMKRTLLKKGVADDAADAAIRKAMASRAGAEMLKSNMTRGVTNQQLVDAAFQRGARGGAFAISAAMQTGEIDITQQGRGIDAGLTALVGGAAGGLLETLPALRALERMFPGLDSAVSKNVVKDFAQSVGIQSALEGSTEAAQEVIQLAALAYNDPTFDMFDPANAAQVIDAFAAGALVGGVTGSAADAVGIGTQVVQKVTESVKSRTKSVPDAFEFDFDADFVPAGNTLAQDITDRVKTTVSSIVNPVINTVRDNAQPALDVINSPLGDRRLFDVVSEAHNKFVADHAAVIDRIREFASNSTQAVIEQAERLTDPAERKVFLDEQVEAIRARVDNIVETVLRPRAQRAEQDVTNVVETAEMSFGDESIFEATPTRFEFGKSNTGGRVADIDIFNPPEGEVQGFTTRRAARNLLDKLRERFPSATDATFAINEREDGTFTVELNEPASAEQLREDDIVTRALERARLSARRNPDKRRHIKVTRSDGRSTIVDFPTLVFAAKDLADVTTDEQARATILGRLLERNLLNNEQVAQISERFGQQFTQQFPEVGEVERDFDALPPRAKQEINQRVNEQLDDERLQGNDRRERRNELLAQELDAIDEDPALRRDLGREEIGDEQSFLEQGLGRGLPTEAQQARESRSRRPFSKKTEAKVMRETFNKSEQLKVFMPGAGSVLSKATHDLVQYVQKELGIKTQVRVVNRQGANRMIAEKHPHSKKVAEVFASTTGPGRLSYIADGDGQRLAYLFMDSSADPKLFSTTIMHELGHLIQFENFNSLSESEKANLFVAFADATRGRKQSSVGGRDEFQLDQAEFGEWMADQLVAWSSRRSTPKTQVEKFFHAIGVQLQRFFAFVRNNSDRFLSLDETYAEFIDAVAARAKGDPLVTTRFFQNEAPEGFSLPATKTAEIAIPNTAPPNIVDRALQKYESQYPTIVKRAMLMRNWMFNAYSVALAPSSSAMMTIAKRVPVAKKLVQTFGRVGHGVAKESQNYHQRVNLMKGRFINRYLRTTEGSDKARILNQLRALDGKAGDPAGKAVDVRALFDEMFDYMAEAGLPVGKIQNYFPRVFSREKLVENRDRIIKHLQDSGMKQGNAEGFYNSLISHEAEQSAALRELEADPLSNQAPGFRNMRSRTLDDRLFDEFLEDNLDAVVSNYVNAAVKRTEYNRFLGMKGPKGVPASQLPRGAWNPRGKLEAILKTARVQGASESDLKRMKQYVDANLGMLGRDFDRALPGARTAMATIMAYQNMRVLLFTVFASLPDIVGPAIRTGNMRQAFDSVISNMKSIAKTDSALHEMARTWGVISDTASNHIMTEYVDNHFMPPTLRKWNDAFFKYTGLEAYTNFTRKMALAVGQDYVKNQARLVTEGTTEKARLRAEAALKELGLDKATVDAWVRNGERVWGGIGNTDSKSDQAIAEALVQFVDESIMRPNPAQRPIAASHPAMMLVFHLKGFMYAYYDIVIKRMAHNFRIADTPAQSVAAVAPALMMMGMTAIGLELREIIQYALSDRDPPTDRMDGWEYIWTLVERTGLTGPGQLAFDFSGADERGMTGAAAIGGPALAQLADILSKPPSQTVPKAIPVVGQVAWMRDGLREVTPL